MFHEGLQIRCNPRPQKSRLISSVGIMTRCGSAPGWVMRQCHPARAELRTVALGPPASNLLPV